MKKIAVLLAVLLAGTLLPALTAPARAVASRTLEVVRQYGDGPVIVPRRVDRVVISFDGRRGDRVRLAGTACRTTLRLGDRVIHPGAAGFSRLPARGEYTMSWRRCHARTTPSLQLQELRVHRLRVDGPAVRVTRHLGFVQAVAVVVPEDGRVQVSTLDEDWTSILLPDGSEYTRRDCWEDSACEEPGPVFLEAGRPLGGSEGPYAVGRDDAPHVLEAGDRLVLLVGAPARVVARATVTHAVSLDGGTVDLSGVRRFQEAALEVALQAGQWVRVEKVAGESEGYPFLLLPDGTQTPHPWDPRLAYWQAPVSGTYRFVFPRWLEDVDATVRLRTMREVATPLPSDGTPGDYAVTTPGEWVVAPVAVSTAATWHQLVGSASAGATGWFASVERRARYYCDLYGPLGCGDLSFDHVDASRPGPAPTYLTGVDVTEPAVLVVGMDADVTGTVTARLNAVTPPPPPARR